MTPRHLLAPARLAGSRLLATQSDERLVDLLRAGSEPAFEAIVSRYRGPLLRYCSALLGRERAEDAVQQAFVNAYDAMRRDDRPLRLRPWLYRIAHNVAHNALRDRALRDEPLHEEIRAVERPEVALERRDRLRAVLASVQDLPERQRDALVLRELEGRSYEEIAAALGVGGGAVRQLLNRARTTLRTAATAVTPTALLLRLPAGGSGAGESVAARVGELTGAAGGGAVAAKVAATALVTGAVAGGAAVAPIGEPGGTKPLERHAAETRAPASQGMVESVPGGPGTVGAGSVTAGAGGSSGSGTRGDEGERDDGGGSNSGRGSGSSDSGRSGSSDSGSGSSDSGSGSSGSGSGSSGSGSGSSGSGSGDGSSGTGDGSSGTGDGSSGTGSGSPGSASSGSGSGLPGTGSGSSGSGSSGSGDSGSDLSGAAAESSGSG